MGRNIFLVIHLGAGGMVYSWPGKVSHLTTRIKKEAQIFQASLFGFLHIRDGSEFHPPVWHVQLAGLPIQPYFNVPDRRLRWVIPPTSNIPGRLWASPGDVLFPAFRQMGTPHHYSSRCIPKEHP